MRAHDCHSFISTTTFETASYHCFDPSCDGFRFDSKNAFWITDPKTATVLFLSGRKRRQTQQAIVPRGKKIRKKKSTDGKATMRRVIHGEREDFIFTHEDRRTQSKKGKKREKKIHLPTGKPKSSSEGAGEESTRN